MDEGVDLGESDNGKLFCGKMIGFLRLLEKYLNGYILNGTHLDNSNETPDPGLRCPEAFPSSNIDGSLDQGNSSKATRRVLAVEKSGDVCPEPMNEDRCF